MKIGFLRSGEEFKVIREEFVCYFFFSGWDCISIGLHIFLGGPNIEIHLPFGFIRMGVGVAYARREIK